jgi:hypothetical protein
MSRISPRRWRSAGKDPLDPRQYEMPVQSYTAALGRDLRGVRIGLLQEMPGQGRVGD